MTMMDTITMMMITVFERYRTECFNFNKLRNVKEIKFICIFLCADGYYDDDSYEDGIFHKNYFHS